MTHKLLHWPCSRLTKCNNIILFVITSASPGNERQYEMMVLYQICLMLIHALNTIYVQSYACHVTKIWSDFNMGGYIIFLMPISILCKKIKVTDILCVCFFLGKGRGETPHMHGHKESNKDLNLKILTSEWDSNPRPHEY